MLKELVARQIAEGLLSAGATTDSISEGPHVVIREIAPYPALFRAEIRRRFGVPIQQTDLDMTIDQLAARIDQGRENCH